MKKYITLLIVFLYYALHQDFWNWREARPLVFGFLPIGLVYHALYALGCAFLLYYLVRNFWPAALERWADEDPR